MGDEADQTAITCCVSALEHDSVSAENLISLEFLHLTFTCRSCSALEHIGLTLHMLSVLQSSITFLSSTTAQGDCEVLQ